MCTNTLACTALQYGTNLNLLDACTHNACRICLVHHIFLMLQHLAGLRIQNVIHRITSNQTLCQRLNAGIAFHNILNPDAGGCTAVILTDDDILRYIYHSTGQVTGVRGTQCGICQALTCASSGDEVLQYGQTFTEIRLNRDFDGTTGCVCHQTSHTCQLTNLVNRASSTRLCHHMNRVKAVAFHLTLQCVGNNLRGVLPFTYNQTVTLGIGDKAALVLAVDGSNLLLGSGNHFLLLFRYGDIREGYGQRTLGGIFIAHGLNRVQYFSGLVKAMDADALVNDLAQLLLAAGLHDFQLEHILLGISFNEAQILRNLLVEDQAACGCIHQTGNGLTIDHHASAHLNRCMNADDAFIICHEGFILIAEYLASTLLGVAVNGQIIGTEDHILGRYGNRLAVLGLQQVVGGQHQQTSFCLCFHGQRQMHCHLVTVEVSVKCGTNQRMQLDRTAFYQNRLESFDTQTMQGRRTVQQNRMSLDDGFQRIPNLRLATLYHLLCGLDIGSLSGLYQTLHNKRLKQLDCHFLRQTALINLQVRTYDDYGTTGVVNTLAQQVLTETSLLALQHIGKGLERAVIRTGDRTTAATIVDQCVNCFLQHTLLIAYNDIRCTQLQQTLQTVISVDDTAVQIIQVGGGKTTAIQLYHRTDFRRNNRNHIHNHPLRTVAGLAECFDYFQTLDDADTLLTSSIFQLCLQLHTQLLQIQFTQQLLDCLSAHHCLEVILELLPHITVFPFGQDLLLNQAGAFARIGYDISGKVQYLLQQTGGHIQNQTHTGGNALKIPDVGNRRCQFNMTHTLTAYLGLGNFYTAAFTDLALIANLLITSAMAFPVLLWAKDTLTEQTVTLRLQCSIVDGFRLLDLAVRPLADELRRSKADFNCIKRIISHAYSSSSPS